jgi:hypothetical protein
MSPAGAIIIHTNRDRALIFNLFLSLWTKSFRFIEPTLHFYIPMLFVRNVASSL